MVVSVPQRKSLVLTLLTKTQNVVWAFIKMLIIVICLLMDEKSISLKPIRWSSTFSFFLESIFDEINSIDIKEVCLKGNVHDFSVGYNTIDKSELLTNHTYLMIENKTR